MEILKFPHPHLFEVCKKVTVFDQALKDTLDEMWEIMKVNKGMGLAANQVGLEQRMFVMEGPEEEQLYIINPEIVHKSIASANLKEGCLSAPGEYIVLAERAAWVELHFQDEKGEKKRWILEGIHGICAQHELDHLNGKSYLQSKSLTKKQRITLAKKWGLKVK